MRHELRFVDAYQPGVMRRYEGPHAGDPELDAAVEREVAALRTILESKHACGLGVNSIGNILAFKGTRLQIVLVSSTDTCRALTVYGGKDGSLWTPVWRDKPPTCDADVLWMSSHYPGGNLMYSKCGVDTAKKWPNIPVAIVSGCRTSGRYIAPEFEVLTWLPSATALHRANSRLGAIAGVVHDDT